MPTFDTPQPISVSVDVICGNVRVVAGERTDTVVEVRPSDPGNKHDVQAARDAKVEFTGGTLVVKAAKTWKTYTTWSDNGSIDVQIELPAGSQVRGTASVSAFHCVGRLGQCELKTAMGDIQVEDAGPVQLRTSGGDIVAEHIRDHAEITTGTGVVRVHEIQGSATIKNSNGDNWIREATGELRVNTANGDITVERSQAAVTAKSANGNVRIGEAKRGELSLETQIGRVEVGIPLGTVAWLDVSTRFGSVENLLADAQAPGASTDTVQVFARNSFGDIVIQRSPAAS